MITAQQRETIDFIVAIFETGKLPSPEAYGTVTVLDDSAGITFGVHQTTSKTQLPVVLREYYARGGQLGVWPLERALEVSRSAVGIKPDAVTPAILDLMTLLSAAGRLDPRMQEAQRVVFETLYWQPAEQYGRNIGLVQPLSYLCLYDLCIHSGPKRVDTLRRAFPEVPPVRGGLEKDWTVALCRARRTWLASFDNPVVRKTVYRVDALLDLAARHWDLARPLTVRGVRID